MVVASEKVLTPEQLSQLSDAVASLPKTVPGVSSEVSPLIPSEDGKAAQTFVPVEGKDGIREATTGIGEQLRAVAPEGVQVYVTGPAGFTADLVNAFSGIDGLLLGVALLAVFIILIIVYRSLLLPVAVLTTSLMALTVALLANWWLAKWGLFMLSGQTQGILFILVIGAATDYSLLYVSRFRGSSRLRV